MRITVKLKLNSWKEKIEKNDDTNFLVAVKEPPVDGKANMTLVKTLAKHFNISSLTVRIASGHISKQKIIEIS